MELQCITNLKIVKIKQDIYQKQKSVFKINHFRSVHTSQNH